MRYLRSLLVSSCLFALLAPALAAPAPPFYEQDIGGTWSEAVGIAFAADGRMLVWERPGRIWIVENGVKISPPLLDISDEVGGWRDYGMLGVALHPNFLSNGYIYLLYVVDHHHLIHAGTPSYNPATNEYFMATIGRITRYTARASDDFHSVDPASRLVLVGESPGTGFPIVHQSHGVGQLVFGTDGTLLATSGDGASYDGVDTGGAVYGSYAVQALADGILRPAEDVGAFRSQLLGSLAGKLIRIDPNTGDGVPSNPFYDGAAPRAPRSRVWALGLRNPCRMTLRPDTGSHDPSDGNPGSVYIGDVGWGTWEDLHTVTGAGQNLGWPVFEGLTTHSTYSTANINNLDAPNPLYNGTTCTRQYFYFRELIKQDTLNALSFPNPCNAGQQIPGSIPKFEHVRPVLDWNHNAAGPLRTGTYNGSGNATTINVGASGSPVSGPQFGANAVAGGVWYTGTDFPATWQNTYFQSDYGKQWIHNIVFDAQDRPTEVRTFYSGAGAVVFLTTHPINGNLYYVKWGDRVRRIYYQASGNLPPQAVASADVLYGSSPFAVQFTGSQSSDPEGQPLTYDWRFFDGTPNSPAANPLHTFVVPGGVPTRFDVELTVTDDLGVVSEATVTISVNNTPPAVEITNLADTTYYALDGGDVQYVVSAAITDAEHGPAELVCEATTILHHNEHTHSDPPDPSCNPTVTISPVGCDGNTYFYEVVLKVTDAAGLSTTDTVSFYPACGDAPVANHDFTTVTEAEFVDVDVLANDIGGGDMNPASVSIVTPPANGSITSINPVTGAVRYWHDGSATTSDSFTYTVADTASNVSNQATVNVTVLAAPCSAVDTTCDGVDDDCDGTADEEFASTPTACGVGACAAVGATSCSAGVVLDSCTAGTPEGSDPTCDGIDQDCDGSADEEYVSTPTACGVGACAAVGATSCSAGVVLDSCAAGTPEGSDPTCDGIDQDCDGMSDEEFASTPTACGVGACASAGATSCAGGVVTDSCTPGTPAGSDPTCDGIDQDCDGTADEDAVEPVGPIGLTVDPTEVSWTPLVGATTFDVVRGDLGTLLASSGDFAASVQECTVDATRATSLPFAIDPDPEQGFWFLVRGGNCAGPGSYESDGAGQVAPRDPQLGAPPACP